MATTELTGVVIGAGDRGANAYVPYLLKHASEGRIVGVAEPDPVRRERFARRHTIPEERRYHDYRELFERPRFADFAVVATLDDLHTEPALLAMERGYHVLLEKPMARTEQECRQLVDTAERTGVLLQICHVMRYAPFFSGVQQVVKSGELGDVLTIQHSENVSYWHYAHSYCRGSFRNVAESSPMILAKSCHDLDLLYWLAGSDPVALTSLARPTELCEENKPEGAPTHCIEGCPHAASCPYDAVEMYRGLAPLRRDIALSRRPLARLASVALRARRLLGSSRGNLWPVSVITDDASPQGVERALRTTRYGRCVYQVGDNDQVSSQTVNVRFASGLNAAFTMHSSSYREGREIRIDGTRGSLVGASYTLEQAFAVTDHKSGRRRRVRFPVSLEAHGGGDWRLFQGFLRALRGEAKPLTTARESLQSHQMAFGAHRSQQQGVVVRW